MMHSERTFLIWSIEHRAWWGPHRRGYTTELGQAGHYPHDAAIELCCTAAVSCATREGGMLHTSLPDVPVRLSDIQAILTLFDAQAAKPQQEVGQDGKRIGQRRRNVRRDADGTKWANTPQQ